MTILYLKSDKFGNILEPMEISTVPWEHYRTCELQPFPVERLDSLVDSAEFMPILLSHINTDHITDHILTGDIQALIAEIPGISGEVKDEANRRIRHYMRELWEGSERLSKEYTVHHALWAAGHVDTCVLDLIQDWHGRPRNRKLIMTSRTRHDLQVVYASYRLEKLTPPYAKVLSAEVAVGPLKHSRVTHIYLLPWGHHEGVLAHNELVFTRKGDFKQYIGLYSPV